MELESEKEASKKLSKVYDPIKEEQLAQRQNLRFPSKIIIIEKQKNLPHNLMVISDTGNNRIVLINEETMECYGVVGNGRVGLVDGNFEEAQFHHPQGLCHIYRDG